MWSPPLLPAGGNGLWVSPWGWRRGAPVTAELCHAPQGLALHRFEVSRHPEVSLSQRRWQCWQR